MNVVLVYKGRYLVRQALELESVSAVLKAAGHKVRLAYDPDVFGVTDNVLQFPALARFLSRAADPVSEILRLEPDVVLFSVLPPTTAWSTEVASRLRQARKVPVIFCGFQPSMNPEGLLRSSPADCVIQGEVEGGVVGLMEALRSGTGIDRIGNVYHRTAQGVAFTLRASPVDLDALPFPDKSLFEPWVDHRESYTVLVSRGCPFGCSYCEETCLAREGQVRYRRRSPARVMEELRQARARYGFREVIFKDSYLSGDDEWLDALMDPYAREIGVPFKCFATVKGFTARTAELLKAGGCYCVEFGLQTWNEALRRDVLSRPESNEEARAAFEACARQRLWYDVDHMLNLPGETEADHERAVKSYLGLPFLNRVKPHFIVYLPRAPILEAAIGCGALPPSARDAVEAGAPSDFYAPRVAGDAARRLRGWSTLLKLLPVLPRSWATRWAERRWVNGLAGVPSLVVALLQGLGSIRSHDLRFRVYLRSYPRRVWRAWRRAVGRRA